MSAYSGPTFACCKILFTCLSILSPTKSSFATLGSDSIFAKNWSISSTDIPESAKSTGDTFAFAVKLAKFSSPVTSTPSKIPSNAAPARPARAPLANPLAAAFPTSATVPPAAALIALSTTVLNIAALPITPNNAGPPTPAAPIPIVITVKINPLNAATSWSFSIA